MALKTKNLFKNGNCLPSTDIRKKRSFDEWSCALTSNITWFDTYWFLSLGIFKNHFWDHTGMSYLLKFLLSSFKLLYNFEKLFWQKALKSNSPDYKLHKTLLDWLFNHWKAYTFFPLIYSTDIQIVRVEYVNLYISMDWYNLRVAAFKSL